jgi:Animal haem peroxidase
VASHARNRYVVDGEEFVSDATSVLADEPVFHFSRVCPKNELQLEATTLKDLAAAMIRDSELTSTPKIPAGYTYLGQFVAHDLTFGRFPLGVEAPQVGILTQERSPSLDLDCLYGEPGTPESRQRYQGACLMLGPTEKTTRLDSLEGFDLPRNPQSDEALIPDPRNDENLVVAQTHLAFMRFHNRVVEDRDRDPSVPKDQLFTQARECVVRHYQWMLREDFLPRIVDGSLVEDVFTRGRKVVEPPPATSSTPTMPVEFAVAAFRLGHSMVRSAYRVNDRHHEVPLGRLFSLSGMSGEHAGGAWKLPTDWIVDFRRFYDFPAEFGVGEREPQFASRIDTLLTRGLSELHSAAIGSDKREPEPNLAKRNLQRAADVKLATGQQMAELLNIQPLDGDEILDGRPGVDPGADLSALTNAQRRQVARNTPLWFYVLREAELNRGVMTGVGGRLVAETFHLAMEGSQPSILDGSAWQPEFGTSPPRFGMVDLLWFCL